MGRLSLQDLGRIYGRAAGAELLEKYISLIRGIGKLKFLQELNMFELRSEMGYKIDELEYLNELCKLGNNCLENVKDAEEACNAKS
ncbi:hypothetical protein IEQ34_010852 [Dendrobium chrysotoxum]|uniref:Uncharacterized protein n=1 Tax=Dendrobium chrysotoxum TaxID=161865 RepID=A0AAV7GXK4_DENCH|nr:hypothetical protein IEQ34_010852 [Dendrobium chrysotoxum]